ncbi:MAG: ATP-dependent metallopeptidase FtsH/Yme1/Tma family protein, partial [Bdellovibrio sp.]
MRSTQKTLALWFFLIIMAVFLFQAYESKHQKMVSDFNYSKFTEAVKAGKIDSVTFRQDSSEISGEIKPEFEKDYKGTHFVIVGNTQDEGYKFLIQNGITPNYEHSENGGFLQSLIVNWLPLVLIVAMFLFIMRQIQVGGGKAMSFGKSRARLLTEHKNRITFKEVA